MDGTARGDVATARARLPARQREALELREEQGLSYEEIAARLEVSRDAVGHVLAHAWINLYDELEGTILASVPPSPECERALGLIVAREDGELDAESADGTWLDSHLEACDRCRRGAGEMREARARCGSRRRAAAAPRSPRPVALVAVLAALLLLGGVAAAFVRDDPAATTVDQGVDAAEASDGDGPRSGGEGKASGGDRKSAGKMRGKESDDRAPAGEGSGETDTASAPVASPAPVATSADDPVDGAASRPTDSSESSGIGGTRRTSSPSRNPQPKSPSTTTSTSPAPPPPPAEPAPSEESDEGPPYGREPPGKAVGRPSR